MFVVTSCGTSEHALTLYCLYLLLIQGRLTEHPCTSTERPVMPPHLPDPACLWIIYCPGIPDITVVRKKCNGMQQFQRRKNAGYSKNLIKMGGKFYSSMFLSTFFLLHQSAGSFACLCGPPVNYTLTQFLRL